MAVFAYRRVESHDPELAEVRLLVAAVVEGVLAGVEQRLMRVPLLFAAHAAVPLGPRENILAALLRHYSAFNPSHT